MPTLWRKLCRYTRAIDILARWTAVFFLLGSTAAGAAEPAREPAQSNVTKPLTAVEPAEIVPKSEQAIKRLQEIQSQIQTTTTIEKIGEDLNRLADKIDAWWEAQALTTRRPRSIFEINDALRQWGNFGQQVDVMATALARRGEEISGLQKNVDEVLLVWKETQNLAHKKRLTKPVQQRVAEVLKEAAGVDAALKERTVNLLKLQSQIAATQKTLVGIGASIEEARGDLGKEVFALDSAALWRALAEPAAIESLPTEIDESQRRVNYEARLFFDDYKDRLPSRLALFLAIWFLLLLLRRSATAGASASDEHSFAKRLLAHSLSSTLLLTLFFSWVAEPAIAGHILRILAFLSAIPVVFLIPVLLTAAWRRGAYIIILLYALDFVRVELLPASLFSRLLLLAIDFMGFGYGIWILRYRYGELTLWGGKRLVLVMLLSLAVAMLGLAVVANVVGGVFLAALATTATIRSGAAALLLHAIAEIIIALIRLGLETRMARISNSVSEFGSTIASRAAKLLRFAAHSLWIVLLFHHFGVLGGVFQGGSNFVTRRWQVGAAEVSLEDLFTFLVVFITAYLLSRLLRFIFRAEIFPRFRLPRGVPGAVDMLSNYVILTAGFLLALAAAGVDLSKITLVLSAVGVGLGFGLQNMVSNFVSGLILAFEHPIQVGDTVEVGSLTGNVQKIGFRASVVRTFEGAEVIIPNGELVWAQVINWSLSDQIRRIEVPVGVAYGTDPNRVLEILQGVARQSSEVLSYPAPDALFEQFGDSSLDFKLRCWTQLQDYIRIRSELTLAVNNAFVENGIQIPFPQRDLHVHWPDGVEGGGPMGGRAIAPSRSTGEGEAGATRIEPAAVKK